MAPHTIFNLWLRWINNKLYFLHGVLLILGGFPLTVYSGRFSGIIFAIGLMVVFTGPFVLIYPEKIRGMFNAIAGEPDLKKIRGFILIDASLRVVSGIFFIASRYV